MLKRKKMGYLWFILLLIGLNFLIQNFDWLHLRISSCSYYYFDLSCATKTTFFVNKLVRFLINIITLLLIHQVFRLGSVLWLLFLFAGLLAIAGMDLLTINYSGFLSSRIHVVLHPIAFSPLIAIGLLALVLLNAKRRSNQV